MADHSKAQADPAQIAQALGRLGHPRQKQEAVDCAWQHNTGDNSDVIEVLERIPDREYGSMADVEKAVGHAE